MPKCANSPWPGISRYGNTKRFQDSLPFSFQASSSNKLSGLKISGDKAHFKRIPHPGHHQDYGSGMVCHLYHRGVLPCSFFWTSFDEFFPNDAVLTSAVNKNQQRRHSHIKKQTKEKMNQVGLWCSYTLALFVKHINLCKTHQKKR